MLNLALLMDRNQKLTFQRSFLARDYEKSILFFLSYGDMTTSAHWSTFFSIDSSTKTIKDNRTNGLVRTIPSREIAFDCN